MYQVSPYKLIPEKEFHNHWENSENRKPGTLGRMSSPGDWCPLASETLLNKTIPRGEWDTWCTNPEYKGLRKTVPVILDQDAVGSCGTEMTAQAIMTIRAFNLGPEHHTKLNPWFIYQETSGGRDGGSNLDTNLRFARDFGCAPEEVWPRSKGWRTKPSAEAYEAAKEFKILEFYDIRNVEEFATALLLGYPVGYGRRGHAITAVTLLPGGKILYANSWGDWGDQGFGTDDIDGVNFGYGAWSVRTTALQSDFSTLRVSELPPMFEPYPTFQN